MHLEAVRIVADALADATIGVSAIVASVPRDAGDAAPPAIAGIYDDSRTGWVARGELPPSTALPALVVTLASPQLQYAGAPLPTRDARHQRETEITVGVHLLLRDTDTQAATEAALYLLRAIRGVVDVLAQPAHAARRTRNGVRLEQLTDLTQVRLWEPVQDTVLAGVVLATWRARESVAALT